jgi:YfiH family protein
MTLKYFSIPQLEKNGKVKTLFTSADTSEWNFEDAKARENFIALGRELGLEPEQMVKSKQTHTDIVKVVNRKNGGDGILRPLDESQPYDGLITNEKNLLLCTVEADCVPVYFYDPVKEVIAMVHSGWKGTVQKISEVAINKMESSFGCRPQDLQVAIGPHICKDCYEVGLDLYDEFRSAFGQKELEIFFTRKNDEKFLLNLQEAVKWTLLQKGVPAENIFSTDICTYHSKVQGHSFCSYRRTKSPDQRMLTAIMMK